jgi:hypothetical protein
MRTSRSVSVPSFRFFLHVFPRDSSWHPFSFSPLHFLSFPPSFLSGCETSRARRAH